MSLHGWLATQGYRVEDGELVPLFPALSPAEAFALHAARMTEARSRVEGPSPKSARRRVRLAERARKAAAATPTLREFLDTVLPTDPAAEARVEALLAGLPKNEGSILIEDAPAAPSDGRTTPSPR